MPRGCHLEHVGGLLAPLGHVLRLGQQIVEEARFVELPDELALEAVLHVVDQEVHHGLGHAATWRENNTRWLLMSDLPDGGIKLCNM